MRLLGHCCLGEFLRGHLLLDLPSDDALHGNCRSFFEHGLFGEEIVEAVADVGIAHFRLLSCIPDLRTHDLRRTLGSWQANTGASLAIIGKSLNHKNPATTAIYGRLDIDPVRTAMERAASAMLTAAGVKPTAEVTPIRRRVPRAAATS